MQRHRLHPIRLLACVLPLLLAAPNLAHAQTVNDSGAWLALFANGDIDSAHTDQWKWWFDGHARFFDDTGGFGQSIVRPGIGYKFGETATVWAGYGWIATEPAAAPLFDEHRIWQQVTWSDDLGNTSLGYRSRLEQRFLETGSDTGWRFRQLVAARRPFTQAPNLTFVAWDEIFLNMNDTNWGAESGFDQNRVFVGLGFKLRPDSPVRIETGYLNQFVGRPGRNDLSNHLISVNLYWSP